MPGPEPPQGAEPTRDSNATFSLADGLQRADHLPDLQLGVAQEQVRRALFGVRLAEHRVDRFTLLESVGRGGMGEVFAAYDPQLDRRVALKLVSAARRARRRHGRDELLAEARAMAKVSHPNVVPVFEVGLHEPEVGEPSVFLAMEFVRGKTLRAWLEQAEPDWRRIVQVYREAGRGLAAMHAAGLVHRDFKPDNAMIDDDGHVRVMDFGLVHDHELAGERHATAAELGEALEQRTRSGTIAGTPAYMAPEQLEGHRVDHRSDQFALCVALYEALWGHRPWQAASVAGLVEAVLDAAGPPAPPRSPVSLRIRRAILRGLARDPNDRWPSMQALLQALGDSPRRAWGRLGVLVAVLASGGALVWARTAAPEPCHAAGAELDAVWNDDVRQRVRSTLASFDRLDAAETSERVTTALDGYANEWQGMRREACEATHVRNVQSEAMLDLRTMCLDARLAQVRSLTEAFVAATDPTTLTEATPAVAALHSVEACGDLEALTAVVAPPEAPADRERLAELRERLAEAHVAYDIGAHARGAPLAAALVEDARALGYAPLLGEALLLHANLLHEGGEPRAAETQLEQAALAAADGADDLLLARIWARLVLVRGIALGEAREALILRTPLEAALRRVGSPAAVKVEGLVSVGQAHRVLKQLEPARAALDEAEALHARELPNEQLQGASILTALGQLESDLNNHDAAIALGERVLEQLRRALGESHPRVAHAHMNLGSALRVGGRLDEAERELLRALAIYDGTIGRDNRTGGLALSNLGSVYRQLERADEAGRYTHEAWTVLERHGSSADQAMVLSNLVAHYLHTDQLDLALEPAERARALWVELYGEQDYRVAVVDGNLAVALALAGRYEEAVVRFERAIAILDATFGVDHPSRYRFVLPLSDTYRRLGRYEDALRITRLAYETQLADARTTPAELADTKYFLAMALWDAGEQRPRALALAEEAYATLSVVPGTGKTQAEFVLRWLEPRRGPKPPR